MGDKWKVVGTAMLGAMLAMTTMVSAGGASESKGVTYIELSKEEAQQLEVNNGDNKDENIAGGIIAYPGEMTEEQKKSYKEKLLSPGKETKDQRKGDVQASWCTGPYLSNVQTVGSNYYFPSDRAGASEGLGPIALTVTVQTTRTATYSANVGVSASVVSAGVGYSFSQQYGVSSSGQWTVTAGTYGRLEAYAMYDKHTWEVWDDDCGTPEDTFLGSGSSYKPNGSVFFKKVIL